MDTSLILRRRPPKSDWAVRTCPPAEIVMSVNTPEELMSDKAISRR